MEWKVIKKDTTEFGTFTLFDSGSVSINLAPHWLHAFQKATCGVIIEEGGLKGIRFKGEIIFLPYFRDIGIVFNPTRLYLIDNERFSLFEYDGSYTMNDYYNKKSHFIFKNGKMGWWKDGSIVIPPIYDNVENWGMNIFETVRMDNVKYFTKDGKEVLTERREVCEDFERPFWLRSDVGEVLCVLECPPLPSLANGNKWHLEDGTHVGLDRFNRKDLIKELINSEDDLPLTLHDLRDLINEFSYEFSAYRFTVKGAKPIEELIKLFKKFAVDDNTWYYIVRLTTAPFEPISASQLQVFNNFIDNLEHRPLGRSFAIGTDTELQPGEVSALIITHYNECCFPPDIQHDWIEVCNRGTLEEVKMKDKELVEYTNDNVYPEFRKDFLEDSYASIFSNVRYNSERDWKITKEILDYVSQKTIYYEEIIKRVYKSFKSLTTDSEKEFYLKYIEWLLSKGVNVNPIKGGKTLLDEVNKKANSNGEEVKMWKKFREILINYGGKSYRDFKDDFLKEHSDYEFALFLLSQ